MNTGIMQNLKHKASCNQITCMTLHSLVRQQYNIGHGIPRGVGPGGLVVTHSRAVVASMLTVSTPAWMEKHPNNKQLSVQTGEGSSSDDVDERCLGQSVIRHHNSLILGVSCMFATGSQ